MPQSLTLTQEGYLYDPDTGRTLPYKSSRRTWAFPSSFYKASARAPTDEMFARCAGSCVLHASPLCLRAPCFRRDNLQNRSLCFVSRSVPTEEPASPEPVVLISAEPHRRVPPTIPADDPNPL